MPHSKYLLTTEKLKLHYLYTFMEKTKLNRLQCYNIHIAFCLEMLWFILNICILTAIEVMVLISILKAMCTVQYHEQVLDEHYILDTMWVMLHPCITCCHAQAQRNVKGDMAFKYMPLIVLLNVLHILKDTFCIWKVITNPGERLKNTVQCNIVSISPH